MSNNALAEDKTVTDAAGCTYTINSSGEATLKKASTSLTGSVTIPATVAEGNSVYTVTSIGEEAFKDCAKITAVTIPSGVTSVGWDCFAGCGKLASFAVEEGNTQYQATGDGLLLYANGKALVRCPSGKTGDVTLPEGITSIDSEAFGGCSQVNTITLPATLTNFGFRNYLSDCSSLGKIVVAEGNATYKSNSDGHLLSADGKGLVCFPAGKIGPIVLPDGIETIADGAFENCQYNEITLPSTLTDVDGSLFKSCPQLARFGVSEGNAKYRANAAGLLVTADSTELVRCPAGITGELRLPEGITRIGAHAFAGCKRLTAISLNEGVTTIDAYALNGCEELATISLPGSLATIGNNVFNGCPKLTSITLPEGITKIGSNAFMGTGLTTVTLPRTLTDADKAFASCSTLTSIGVAEGNTKYTSLEGLLLSADGQTLVMCPAGKEGRLSVPAGVTAIGDDAFPGCKLLNAVYLDKNVTTIGSSAFEGCERLTSLSFYFGDDYTVEDLGKGNKNIGVSVTLVGQPEKSRLEALKRMLSGNNYTAELIMPLGIELDPASGLVTPYRTVKLPAETHDGRAITYTLSINVGEFQGIADSTYTFMPSVRAQSFAIEATAAKPEGYDGIDISCPSKMFEYYMDAADFEYSFDDEKGTATLTGVGASLTEAVLPDSVWAGGKGYVLAGLGKGAFKGLCDLTSVTLPDGLEAITDEAFFGCAKLAQIKVNTSNRAATAADVTWPSKLRSIGAGAFNGCAGMAGSLELPATLESIGEGAFKACSSLTEVSLNLNSSTTIAESAFAGCSELTKVTVNAPEGIESSQLEAVAKVFTECSKLTTVEVKAPTGTDTSKLSEVLGTNVKVEVSTLALRIVGQGSGSKARSGVYDLSGRRVGENHRGLVVEQGKLRLRK